MFCRHLVRMDFHNIFSKKGLYAMVLMELELPKPQQSWDSQSRFAFEEKEQHARHFQRS